MGREPSGRTCDDAAGACPHINAGYTRCADRLRLGRLHEAFGLCAGRFGACPTFQDLAREQPREYPRLIRSEDPADATPSRGIVRLTLDRSGGHPIALRRTGT